MQHPTVHSHKTVHSLFAGYFTFWVVLSLIWGLVATVIATLLPIWESREALISMCKYLVGKGGPPLSKAHPAFDSQPDLKVGPVPTGTTADDSAHNSKFNV